MSDQAQVRVLGFSEAVSDMIQHFMSEVGEQDMPFIPMIGLVHSSAVWMDDGTCVRTGNRFVLSAIAKQDLDDEICIKDNDVETAVRIPNIESFFGSYYFDIVNGEIVNIKTESDTYDIIV